MQRRPSLSQASWRWSKPLRSARLLLHAVKARAKLEKDGMIRTLKPIIATVDARMVRTVAREQRLQGRAGIKHREPVLQDEPLCRTCKAAVRVTMVTVVDHIAPLAEGGTNAAFQPPAPLRPLPRRQDGYRLRPQVGGRSKS